MGSRGASERLRPPGDDINSSDGREDRLACGWCGSPKAVDSSRPRRCGPCRADEQVIRSGSAGLTSAPRRMADGRLGRKADQGTTRKQVDTAKARLAGRKRSASRAARPLQPPSAPVAPSVPRRVNPSQKRAGARRLKLHIERVQNKLAATPVSDPQQPRLRNDLAVARRLLSDWGDGVH